MMLPKHIRSLIAFLSIELLVALCPVSTQANVYATNIKVNGSLTTASAGLGASVNISYVLNEPPSAGVTVRILAGNTAVRTLTFNLGINGALRGTNNIVWNGKDEANQNVPAGTYGVSITAASTGYPVWTQTTADSNLGHSPGDLGTYLNRGRGLAVDRNTNSPYYGRVFAANASLGADPNNLLGDRVGIIKCNADGTFADEGGFSDGGHAWAGDLYSPWKLAVSADDFVYVDDMSGSGEIYRWDPTISPASQLYVLRTNNTGDPDGLGLSGPAVVGTGTNTLLYMADITPGASIGIVQYALTNNGVCATNDTGTPVVQAGSPSDLNSAPYDVAVDAGGAIYTIQYLGDYTDTSARVLRFPAFTNGGAAEVTADWTNGPDGLSEASSGPWCDPYAVAVDPTGTYVAVAFAGDLPGGNNGNTKILYATNGVAVTNLDVYVSGDPETDHTDTAVAWDAVGNLYYIHDGLNIAGWRAVSPPGSNSATTKAFVTLQIGITSIHISSIHVAGSVVTITFTGATDDLPSAYALLSAASPNATYSLAAGAVITGSAGNYQATVPVNGSRQFYRVRR